MPLQFRRGTEAEINEFKPVLKRGEPLWDETNGKLYIGDGESTADQLNSITGVSDTEVGAVLNQLLENGTSPNISFEYDAEAFSLSLNLDFTTPYSEEIVSSAGFRGSLSADDCTVVFESSEGKFINLEEGFKTDIGPETDDSFDVGSDDKRFKTGFFNSIDVKNQINVEDLTVTGLIKTDEDTVLFNSTTSTLSANIIRGDLYGSVFADDSSTLVDSITGDITANVITAEAITLEEVNTGEIYIREGDTGLSVFVPLADGIAIIGYNGSKDNRQGLEAGDFMSSLTFKSWVDDLEGDGSPGIAIGAAITAQLDPTADVETSSPRTNIFFGVGDNSDDGGVLVAKLEYTGKFTANLLATEVYSVADKPLPPATIGMGARAFVSDAVANTFGTAYQGGGSNKVPVYSDGTGWFIG